MIVEDVVLDLDVIREPQFAVRTLMGHGCLAHDRFVAPSPRLSAGPKVPTLGAVRRGRFGGTLVHRRSNERLW